MDNYTKYRVPSHSSTTPARISSAGAPYSLSERASPREASISAGPRSENRTLSLNRREQFLGASRPSVTVSIPSQRRGSDLDDYVSIPIVSDIASQANATTLGPASVSSPSNNTTNITPQIPSHTLSSPTLASGQKRRGRPKGWKPGLSYNLLRSGTRDEINAAKQALPAAHPRLTAVPFHRRLHSSSRPFRASQHEGATPPNYSLKPKRRGRPAKKPDLLAADIWASVVDPHFISFQCEWEGCHAELQNWDTLRRHLVVVHCRGKMLECQWGTCGDAPKNLGKMEIGMSLMDANNIQGHRTRKAFANGEGLRAHIENAHLIPFLWHVGDGPRNSSALRHQLQLAIVDPSQDEDVEMGREGEDIPDYLFNEKGEQVTPWVKYQELEDLHTYRENRRKLRELKAWLEDILPSDEDNDSRPLGTI